MAETKQTYNITISEEARRALDEIAQAKSNARMLKITGNKYERVVRRAALAPYFHDSYVDNRPDYLRKSNAWSINERVFMTYVSLKPSQVRAVLTLAVEHNIDPKPSGTLTPTQRGTLNYLLSTFLEAVLLGNIKVKEIPM